jgi:hypothetical protein
MHYDCLTVDSLQIFYFASSDLAGSTSMLVFHIEEFPQLGNTAFRAESCTLSTGMAYLAITHT